MKDPVEIVRDMIKIDTRNPPGITTEAVEYLSELFSSYNTRVYTKEEGKDNIVIEISRGDPTLMLASHLDTVPGGDELLNPVIVDGKLYGRGSCDAKGCIAAIACAAMVDSVDIGLKLAFTADEEIGGVNGLGYVFERDRADAVLIGEPTGSSMIGVLQAAVLAIDIEFRGEAGHTASQDSKEGAIYRASRYILEKVESFRSLKGDFSRYKQFFNGLGMDFEIKSWQAVFNPAMIRGGIKRNVVAPKCTVCSDVRFAPWISMEDVRNELYDENVDYRVEGFLQPYGVMSDSVRVEDDTKFLKIIGSAVESEGLKPKAVFSLGVGDTRHVRKHGIPAFYLGPGGGNMHGDDEFVYINELRKVCSIYKKIISMFRTF
ncbi:M20 family metallopeptidase [Archaeoglobus neptunius]|uniref:M20 family metallopeptidase n=1 Tax=Archaeoglobus neptunius TaxID=2798580 RepID=UPI001929596D|nr:M20/M25/M40 family metallo-hydrolase [Archaeoglobus neptunius]